MSQKSVSGLKGEKKYRLVHEILEAILTILTSLRDALPELPKKLTIAALYAIDHPDRMALDSMRGTAKNVGVTSTTMLRLARQLGFESYEDFRQSFQSELVRGGFGSRAGALHDTTSEQPMSTICEQILAAAETNLKLMKTEIDQSELDRLSKVMRQAPNIYLVGSGALFWLASMMKNIGHMVMSNMRLVGAEYAIAAEAMGGLREDEVVICFAMNPTAKRTIDAIEFAKARGAYTVAIADHPSSPIARGADFLFCGNTTSPHYYPSAAPMMLIVEIILSSYVANGDGCELARIEEFEAVRSGGNRYVEW